jgi:hypothetical protein
MVLSSSSSAAERGQRVVEATYKLTDGLTAATCFLLERPKPDDKGTQILLVTAAHVLENFKGEQVRLILRKPKGPDEIEMMTWPFRIRNGDKPVWVKHRETDVAALAIDPPAELRPKTLPVDILATADAWKTIDFEPGDLIRLVGYPHAMLFEPNSQGYPTTRLGAIAGFPLKPSEKSRMFLIDCNVFEGDSGGPIYFLGEKPADGGPRPLLILGLLHGQHFLNENIRTAYQTGEFRHRFGIGMVVYSLSIIETINQVPKE